MIVSRPFKLKQSSGREKTLNHIFQALSAKYIVKIIYLKPFFAYTNLEKVNIILCASFKFLFYGMRWPLQSFLFWSPKMLKKINKEITMSKPNSIYFDGIRAGLYLTLLNNINKDIQTVCDFDDLISQRLIANQKEMLSINFGYLDKNVSVFLKWILSAKHLLKIFYKYEIKSVLALEQEIVKKADHVTLVSAIETKILRKSLYGSLKNKCIHISCAIPKANKSILKKTNKLKLFFIGSDMFPQNRCTISFLISLWRKYKFKNKIHFYGYQSRNYEASKNVVFKGFQRKLASIYKPGSILLAPSFISGGVKTKVLEAIAYNIPVIGTKKTFEGLNYPFKYLIFSKQKLINFLTRPQSYLKDIRKNSAIIYQNLQLNHSYEKISKQWQNIIIKSSI